MKLDYLEKLHAEFEVSSLNNRDYKARLEAD